MAEGSSGSSGNGTTLEGFLAWFPNGKQDPPGWRFDVITLLAIIGEGSVGEHAQTISASAMCLLPRIIPAPQALLKPTRPQRLPEVTAKMAGVYGGVVLDTVGFFANIIHPLEDLKPFAFKVLEIKHKHLIETQPDDPPSPIWKRFGWSNMAKRRTNSRNQGRTAMNPAGTGMGSSLHLSKRTGSGPNPPPNHDKTSSSESINNHSHPHKEDTTLPTPTSPRRPPPSPLYRLPSLEANTPLQRRPTVSEKISDVVTNPIMATSTDRYTVPPTFYSPLHLIAIISFMLTVSLIAAAWTWEDGTAIVAILLISLASSVVGYASYWRPLLMNRQSTNKVPRGDVVIRTREGAFVLIKCTEEVARELYSGTEECQYVSTKFYRAFMGIGMVLLMVAVVLLGNCGWESQAFIGASYILLNGVYWALGLLPYEYFWDLGRYVCEDITPEDAKRADEVTGDDSREGIPSFTRTLWYAIRETKHGAWVERSGALPGTDQWRRWLREAIRMAGKGEAGRRWGAVGRKNDIMREEVEEMKRAMGEGEEVEVDEAWQRAPLMEVQRVGRVGTFSSGL